MFSTRVVEAIDTFKDSEASLSPRVPSMSLNQFSFDCLKECFHNRVCVNALGISENNTAYHGQNDGCIPLVAFVKLRPWAQSLRGVWFDLSDEEMELLTEALKYHSYGNTDADITVQVLYRVVLPLLCWSVHQDPVH
jgi:hypothetical protein